MRSPISAADRIADAMIELADGRFQRGPASGPEGLALALSILLGADGSMAAAMAYVSDRQAQRTRSSTA